MPEELLHRFYDGLADPLSHCIITGAFSWQPPQLIHIIVDVSYIHSEHPGSDEIHGGDFHLQIPFGGGLPLTPVDGPIAFSLPMCGSVVEHLMEDERPL